MRERADLRSTAHIGSERRWGRSPRSSFLDTILSEFYDVASGTVPYFIAIFAAGNFLGPVLLGRYFDSVGRKPMIALSYLGSAAMAVMLGLFLRGGELTEWSFIALVGATFFLASSGASAAYLTVSEIFPMETRALAIGFFIGAALSAWVEWRAAVNHLKVRRPSSGAIRGTRCLEHAPRRRTSVVATYWRGRHPRRPVPIEGIGRLSLASQTRETCATAIGGRSPTATRSPGRPGSRRRRR